MSRLHEKKKEVEQSGLVPTIKSFFAPRKNTSSINVAITDDMTFEERARARNQNSRVSHDVGRTRTKSEKVKRTQGYIKQAKAVKRGDVKQ